MGKLFLLGEVAGGTFGLTDSQVTALSNSLQSFGSMLLDNFIKLVPALAVIAAIWFIINLIRNKVGA